MKRGVRPTVALDVSLISRKIKNSISVDSDVFCGLKARGRATQRQYRSPYHIGEPAMARRAVTFGREERRTRRTKASLGGSQVGRERCVKCRTMNRLLSGSRKSSDRQRLSASNPLHRMAEFINERINPKPLLERINPAPTWGLGT